MVLFDLYCDVCEEVSTDVLLETKNEETYIYCGKCGKKTRHNKIFNMCVNNRYRYNDFPTDRAFYRGQVRSLPPVAHALEDCQSVKKPNGDVMHDSPRYSDDARSERRDRLYFDNDSKEGRRPIYFNAKGS